MLPFLGRYKFWFRNSISASRGPGGDQKRWTMVRCQADDISGGGLLSRFRRELDIARGCTGRIPFINIQSLKQELPVWDWRRVNYLTTRGYLGSLPTVVRMVIATFSPHVADAWFNSELSTFCCNRPRPETSDSANHCCRDR